MPNEDASRDIPLPLLVAEKWDFPLAYHTLNGEYHYAIQDWIIGLTDAKNSRRIWSDWKRANTDSKVYDWIVQLPYKAKDGKTYQLDFTTDEGL